MNFEIIAVGSFVPPDILTNEDLANHIDTTDDWIRSRTGIQRRHIAKQNTSELATFAALDALQSAGMAATDIELIIVATFSPDYLTPATSCQVQKNIGAVSAVAFDINAACSGFIFALSTAQKFLAAGAYQNALVIGAENLSKMLDWSDRSTSVIFGDGAGAVLIQKTDKPRLYAEQLKSIGDKGEFITAGHVPVAKIFENKPIEMSKISMNGREVFNFATKEIPKSIVEVLAKAHVLMEDIAYIIPHQANIRIVDTIAKKLNLPIEKFFTCMDEFGNTSAASIPIALHQMLKQNRIQKGDKLLLTGFGGGLTFGTILLQY